MYKTPRIVAIVVTLFGLVAGGLLSVSDRFPGFARRLGSVVDPTGALRDTVPTTDFSETFHFVGWGLVAFAASVAAWRLVLMPVAAGVVFLASVAVEVLQREYSTTRAASMADIGANAAGILAGLGLAAGFVLLVSLVGRLRLLMRPAPSRHR